MGERKRHHTVPRFLLNRFAAREDGDKWFVWRIGSDGVGRLISTRDAAVHSRFYGAEPDGLEAALANAEGHGAELLRRVDAGEELESLADDLWGFMHLVGWRGGTIRLVFEKAAESALHHIRNNADHPSVRDGVAREFDSAFDQEFDKVVALFPAEHRAIIRSLRPYARQHTKQSLQHTDIAAMLRGYIEAVQREKPLPALVQRGHNNAICKLLNRGVGPNTLQPTTWERLIDRDASLIIGESPVVAVCGATGETGSPWKFGKDAAAYYLPVAPTLALVGVRKEHRCLTAAELNAASAELSENAVFAARFTDAERELAQRVGRRWMPLSEEEIAEISEEALRGFGGAPTCVT